MAENIKVVGEFAVIERYFKPLTRGRAEALGLRDDAALLPSLSPGHEWVVTKDTIMADVHFFQADDPFTLAKKLCRVNLSDLAAKGANPKCYLLSTAFPKNISPGWIERFAAGLKEENQQFDIYLLGGDTVSHDGKLMLTMTAFGEVPKGTMLQRAGAKPGDKIYVTGTIGDSFLGLWCRRQQVETIPQEIKDFMIGRYLVPLPRITLGRVLKDYASSGMDISDGLLQDAGHIADVSGVELVIEKDKVPLSHAAKWMLEHLHIDDKSLLSGGDDYELLFTMPQEREEALMEVSRTLGLQVTAIGDVKEGEGVTLVDVKGEKIIWEVGGYQHF